ncbi:hypothetical protein D3C76_1411640 [compost metagenome]
MAQQFIWLIGGDFKITRVGFTGQAVTADFGHSAGLAFPRGLNVETGVTLARILSNALGKLLQGCFVNTVQVVCHLISPMCNTFMGGVFAEESLYQLVGWLARNYFNQGAMSPCDDLSILSASYLAGARDNGSRAG